jgi:hypothetical protein
VSYLVALRLVGRGGGRRRVVVGIALAIQVAPLFAPLLLSTDAYSYWVYGDIARSFGNPYVDVPTDFPELAGLDEMGEKWLDRTTVYGPVFTLASALADGGTSLFAALVFKSAAALALVAVVLLAARTSVFAAAFVGWNPVVAIHAAGGGHNDAWMIALVVAALVLAVARRYDASGAAWATAVFVKWMPLVLLPLHLLAQRARGRPLGLRGLALATVVIAALAFWRFGVDWLRAVAPLADNATETTSFALPHRLSQLGVPLGAAVAIGALAFAAAYLWLARQAMRGRARPALAAGLLVLCSPYVTPWYVLWVVPLAAIDEDRTARVLALALTAYLLPQTIPV